MTADKEALIVKATNGIAIGGITMPAWWPSLAETSNVAAQLVPIASLIWILFQIYHHARRALRTWRAGDEG